MTAPSRLEAARRNVRIARYSIAALGTGAFAVAALVAQANHPGRSRTARTATSGAQASLPSEPASFANAAAAPEQQAVPISPAPSEQAPVVESSGS